MVPSIRVARLLVHCVLIGSLAELLFSFCMQSVLAFLQMVDAITGIVISSMVIVLALKVYCDTCHRPLGIPGEERRRRTNKRSVVCK
jgi:hypothetical protein